jgi:hypothetical protein
MTCSTKPVRWVVGEQSAGTKIHRSLYEHWNGTAWSVVTAVIATQGGARFLDIAGLASLIGHPVRILGTFDTP